MAEQLQGHLEVYVTDNRAVMLSVKRDARHKGFSVRLHHILVGAPPAILQALGAHAGANDAEASCQLDCGRHVKSGQPRNSLRLGSFVLEENPIRIQPSRDQTWIPLC